MRCVQYAWFARGRWSLDAMHIFIFSLSTQIFRLNRLKKVAQVRLDPCPVDSVSVSARLPLVFGVSAVAFPTEIVQIRMNAYKTVFSVTLIFPNASSVLPDYQTTKSSIASRKSQLLNIVTRKIQSGNTEFLIEEGYGNTN